MRFTTIHCVIVVLYLAGATLFGIIGGTKQTGTGDYFLGSKKKSWRFFRKESSH